MRLALKLVVVFTAGNIVLAVLYGYLAIRREVYLFHQAATTEAETVALRKASGPWVIPATPPP